MGDAISQQQIDRLLGDLVRLNRVHRGWSQRELVLEARLGSVSRLSRVETGEAPARSDELERILRAISS